MKVYAKRTFSAGRDKKGMLISFTKGEQYDEDKIPKNTRPYFQVDAVKKDKKKKGPLTTKSVES